MNLISKEEINDAIEVGHTDLKKITNFDHELNTHVREVARIVFTPVTQSLAPTGVLIMFYTRVDSFQKALGYEIPKATHSIFTRIFFKHLLKLEGVQQHYLELTGQKH